jgi:hypothetical protein
VCWGGSSGNQAPALHDVLLPRPMMGTAAAGCVNGASAGTLFADGSGADSVCSADAVAGTAAVAATLCKSH